MVGDDIVVAVTVEILGNYLGQEIDGKFRYLRVWKLFENNWKVIAGSVVTLNTGNWRLPELFDDLCLVSGKETLIGTAKTGFFSGSGWMRAILFLKLFHSKVFKLCVAAESSFATFAPIVIRSVPRAMFL